MPETGADCQKEPFWISPDLISCKKWQIPAHDPEIHLYCLIKGKQRVITGEKCTLMDAIGRQNSWVSDQNYWLRKRRAVLGVGLRMPGLQGPGFLE